MKINVNLKVSDMFGCTVQDRNGNYVVEDYCDYVPDFMPEDHFGDYVELEIDAKTGQILNWRPNALALLKQFIEDQNETV